MRRRLGSGPLARWSRSSHCKAQHREHLHTIVEKNDGQWRSHIAVARRGQDLVADEREPRSLRVVKAERSEQVLEQLLGIEALKCHEVRMTEDGELLLNEQLQDCGFPCLPSSRSPRRFPPLTMVCRAFDLLCRVPA